MPSILQYPCKDLEQHRGAQVGTMAVQWTTHHDRRSERQQARCSVQGYHHGLVITALCRTDLAIVAIYRVSSITAVYTSAAIGLSLRSARAARRLPRPSRILVMATSAAASRMPRRPLGQTGLEVSVLGFGASPLGGVFQVTWQLRTSLPVTPSKALGLPLAPASLPPPPAAAADWPPWSCHVCRRLTRARVLRP